MLISSATNPKYKYLLQLHTQHKHRQTSFLIEGFREVSRALKANVKIEYMIFSEDSFKDPHLKETFGELSGEQNCLVLTHTLFKKLSLRENPDGFIGVAQKWIPSLENFNPKDNGLYLLVEGIEKPGNLGALMRSAEATAVDGFFIANPVVNIFNPNVIRASQGAVFNLNIYWDTSSNLLNFLRKTPLQILATTPYAQENYWDCDMRKGTVICVGSEANGLSKIWLENAKKVVIPMYGDSADSLNAGVSGTLCLYEAQRQRRTTTC